jgi:hypothetical protein
VIALRIAAIRWAAAGLSIAVDSSSGPQSVRAVLPTSGGHNRAVSGIFA